MSVPDLGAQIDTILNHVKPIGFRIPIGFTAIRMYVLRSGGGGIY